jgi:predicted pyridoxine 5'-phosphate oxidase superfamily flavin-nucleotide-binding protein
MSRLYEESHRRLQAEFETTRLADAVEQASVRDEILDEDAAFIHSRDMFFLSTVNAAGQPTVSYKGGDPEFVKVVNPTTLVFPSYDGNGMFLSMGNLDTNPRVGLLFIDFETPARRRIQGTASLHRDHPLKAAYPEAELLVEVTVTELWVNCPRYIHRYRKVDEAEHIPRSGVETPLALWKRIDRLQPMLSKADQIKAEAAGYITAGEYEAAQRRR